MPEKLELYGVYVYYVVHIYNFGMLRVRQSGFNILRRPLRSDDLNKRSSLMSSDDQVFWVSELIILLIKCTFIVLVVQLF